LAQAINQDLAALKNVLIPPANVGGVSVKSPTDQISYMPVSLKYRSKCPQQSTLEKARYLPLSFF